MPIRRLASSAAFAASLAALPLSAANAQYYYGRPYYPPPAYRNPCWFPLFWPFCVAGAIVGTAGAVATAPFRPPPPYYYPYYRPWYYPRPPYNYGYYGPR